jgi:anti-sigma regulatory factor (Ser/Thr protein kinase)
VIRIAAITSVRDTTEVAAARRLVTKCAAGLHFSENATARVALAATELATNLIKHGGGGDILVGSNDEIPGRIDLIAIDKGKGIANLPAAMKDGFSTAGSPGTGLGAVARRAIVFDVYSSATGTAVLCRLDDEERARTPSPLVPSPDQQMHVAGICIPYPGEPEPGDAWGATRTAGAVTIVIADGLGHGGSAAEASVRAVRVFKESQNETTEQIIRAMQEPLRATRGAAVGIARIHLDRAIVEFTGVGNIACNITADVSRRTVSHNGTVGHEMRKVQSFNYPWTADSILVMHSDGLSTSWSLDHYPGLAGRDAALIAAVLYRDHCRGSDDATIVVAKA